ncbi:hypothetical protein CKM354_001269000 [Cercospora kikuchii]|uniref:Uncharacterized protein n=1 Tax=Cercospora kikuchii TaxID=84275 RepID=A0A9P3L2Z2_9PEZI|nr:uncharacterized protein CKM354_001269000 [Cercospora kikuchii]GIZ49662.1 hypothetical protein CKM354_001269000 [Cercospora kikuchii]
MSVPDEVMSRSPASPDDLEEGSLELVESIGDSLLEAMPGLEYPSSTASPSQPLQTEDTTARSVPYQLQSAGDEVEQYTASCPYPTPPTSRSSSPVRRECPPLEPKQDASRFWPTPNGVKPLGAPELDLLPVQQMSQNLFVGIMQLTPQQSQLEVISSSPESLAPATPVRNQNVTERGTFNMETPPDYAKSAALDFGTEMLNDLDDLLAAGPIVDPAYDSILPKTPSPPGSPSLRQEKATTSTPVSERQDCLERTLDDELLDEAEKIELPGSDMPPPPRSASVVKTKTVTDGLKKNKLPNRPRPLLQPAEIRQVHRDEPTVKDADQTHSIEGTSETEVEVIVLGEPSPYEMPTPSQFETDLQTGAAKVIKLLSDQPAPCQWACIRKKPVLQSAATEPDARPRAGRRKKQKRARDARVPVSGTGFVEEVRSTQDQSIHEQTEKQSKAAAKVECSKITPKGTSPTELRKAEPQADATGSIPTTTMCPTKIHEDVKMQDVGTEVGIKRNAITATAGSTSVAAIQDISKTDAQLPALTELHVAEQPAGHPISIVAVLSASPPLPAFKKGDPNCLNVTREHGPAKDQPIPHEKELHISKSTSALATAHTPKCPGDVGDVKITRKVTDAGCQMDSEPWPCAEPGCNRPSERCLINERNLGCESFEALSSGRVIMHSSTSVSPVGSPYCWRCRLEHRTRRKQSTSWAMREAVRKQAEASWLLEERRRIERCHSNGLTKRALKTAAKKRKRAEMQSGARNIETLPARMTMEAALESAEISSSAQQNYGCHEATVVASASPGSAGAALLSINESVSDTDDQMAEPDVKDGRTVVPSGAVSNVEIALRAQNPTQDPSPIALCEDASTRDAVALPEHREGMIRMPAGPDLGAAPRDQDEDIIHASDQPVPASIEDQVPQSPAQDTAITECPASPRPRPAKPDFQACMNRMTVDNMIPTSGSSLLLTMPISVHSSPQHEVPASKHLHVEAFRTAAPETVCEKETEPHLMPSPSSVSRSSSPVTNTSATVHDFSGSPNSSPRTSSSRYASHTPSPLRSVQSVEETPPTSPLPHVQPSSKHDRELTTPPPESRAMAVVPSGAIDRMPRTSLEASPIPLHLEKEVTDPLASTVLEAIESHRKSHDAQTPVHLHFCSCGRGLARFPEKLPCRRCLNEDYWRYLDELDVENKENIPVTATTSDSEHEPARSHDLCRLCRSLVTFDEQGLCVPCANPILTGSEESSRPRKRRRGNQGIQQRLRESSELSVEADGAVSVEHGVLNLKRRPLKGILKRR